MLTPDFTPGPWEVRGQKDELKITTATGYIVAKLNTIQPLDESVPNAHLISAAPELYRLLKAAWPYMVESEDFSMAMWGIDLQEINAALCKAEGRAS